METKTTHWPHAPEHRLCERGNYIVTCGTYRKQHFLNTPDKLSLVQNLLFELAEKYEWNLQAWAIMSNHYHFVASSPENPASLKTMLSTLHTLSARELNRMDGKPKRRVWYNYFDSRITYEKSWLARLKYVHHNPVHHGVALNAENYAWCSAAWFAREAGNAFVKTVSSFKIDQVKVYDEYEASAINMECAGLTALSEPHAKAMERGGPKGGDSRPTSLSKAQARTLQSAVKPAHSKPAQPHSKSAVKPAHSKPAQPHSKAPATQNLRAVSSCRTPKDLRCKYCNSTDVVKAGTRKLKSGVKQLYKCSACQRRFSSPNRNTKLTDPDIILKSLIAACRGQSYEEIARFIQRRYQQRRSTSAISKWVKEYHPPYLKMRDRNKTVTRVVISNVFTHRDLNYNFQVHVPKLALCPLRELKEYLIKLPGFINHEYFETAERCSQIKNEPDLAVKHTRNTQACKDALKALQFAKTNHQRHDVVEQFMLNCDTYTIAAEVPVWMKNKKLGLIAGHIDLLQWKFDTLYILDFKPNAAKEQKRKVATQLNLYAMALSCRTKVPLKQMRCAWFDGEDFYSFRPKAEI